MHEMLDRQGDRRKVVIIIGLEKWRSHGNELQMGNMFWWRAFVVSSKCVVKGNHQEG